MNLHDKLRDILGTYGVACIDASRKHHPSINKLTDKAVSEIECLMNRSNKTSQKPMEQEPDLFECVK